MKAQSYPVARSCMVRTPWLSTCASLPASTRVNSWRLAPPVPTTNWRRPLANRPTLGVSGANRVAAVVGAQTTSAPRPCAVLNQGSTNGKGLLSPLLYRGWCQTTTSHLCVSAFSTSRRATFCWETSPAVATPEPSSPAELQVHAVASPRRQWSRNPRYPGCRCRSPSRVRSTPPRRHSPAWLPRSASDSRSSRGCRSRAA